MDDIDRAAIEELRHRNEALRKQLAKALPLTGACYWCAEECGCVFCDAGCAEDWEKEQRRRARDGKI